MSSSLHPVPGCRSARSQQRRWRFTSSQTELPTLKGFRLHPSGTTEAGSSAASVGLSELKNPSHPCSTPAFLHAGLSFSVTFRLETWLSISLWISGSDTTHRNGCLTLQIFRISLKLGVVWDQVAFLLSSGMKQLLLLLLGLFGSHRLIPREQSRRLR